MYSRWASSPASTRGAWATTGLLSANRPEGGAGGDSRGQRGVRAALPEAESRTHFHQYEGRDLVGGFDLHPESEEHRNCAEEADVLDPAEVDRIIAALRKAGLPD